MVLIKIFNYLVQYFIDTKELNSIIAEKENS